MKTRASLLVGTLVACGYLGVAVVTAHVSGHRVLPLYEGIGQVPSYQWVNPPVPFQAGNVVPKANTTKIALSSTGNAEGAIASSDTQFIVTLSPRAIPPKSGSPSASVVMEPLDAATLSALPAGTRADGNAYRLTVTYDPNLGTITRYAKPASVVLNVPLPANRGIYFSKDGNSWSRIAAPAPKGQANEIGGSFQDMGIFIAGTTHRPTASKGSSGTSIGLVIVAILVGVLLVGGAVWFLMKLMRPAPARTPQKRAPQKQTGSRRPPPRRR